MDKPLHLQTDIDVLLEIAESLCEQTAIDNLNELTVKLSANRFYLVVIGLFKRGKSSLINALIGQKLAPIAATPLTSVITFFEFAEVTSAKVVLKDGEKKSIPIEDVIQYISEELNPSNLKNVLYVCINHKSKILQNLTIVDTPGIGSLFSHNNNTTMDFLPRIDAALFVTSADIPISKSDKDLLIEVQNSIAKVLFVMNKSDVLKEEDLRHLTSYNLKMLREIFKNTEHDIELITVSARNCEIANWDNKFGNIAFLEHKINNQIIDSKDEILLQSSRRRIYHIANYINALLTIQFNSLHLPIQELERKRDEMQQFIDFMLVNIDDFESIVKGRIKQLQIMVTTQSDELKNHLISYCQEVLVQNSSDTWNKIKKSSTTLVHQELHDYLIKQFQDKKNQLEISVKNEFQSILRQYSANSHSFLNRIVEQMKDILGVDIDNIVSNFDLDIYTSFYFKDNVNHTLPVISKNKLLKIFPEKYVKQKILIKIHSNCMDLINPNTGRMRSDITYKIDESYRKFKYHFDQKLFELFQSSKGIIEDSIKAKESVGTDIKQAIALIEKKKITINSILETHTAFKNIENNNNR